MDVIGRKVINGISQKIMVTKSVTYLVDDCGTRADEGTLDIITSAPENTFEIFNMRIGY